jgi:hypothetical protein
MSITRIPVATLANAPVHPVADLFPYLGKDELIDLAQDIEENGQLQPIVLFEGAILDGRNRLAALKLAGFSTADTIDYGGDDPVGFIMSINLRRRHLSTGQLALLAVSLLPHLEARAAERQAFLGANGGDDPSGEFTSRGQSRDEAAAMVGVGGQAVTRAKALVNNAPHLAEQVRNNERTLNDAYNEHKRGVDRVVAGPANATITPYEAVEAKLDRALDAVGEALALVEDYDFTSDPAARRAFTLRAGKLDDKLAKLFAVLVEDIKDEA